MIEAFEDIDLFFDCTDVLFADWYLLHCDKNSIVQVDAFVYFSVGSLSYFLD